MYISADYARAQAKLLCGICSLCTMNTITLSFSKDELRSKFLSLKTPQDIADLLEIDLQRLYYHIYIVPESARYTKFDIPKRRGGVRTISAPATSWP